VAFQLAEPTFDRERAGPYLVSGLFGSHERFEAFDQEREVVRLQLVVFEDLRVQAPG
jgi:hypothetical protein